MRVRNSSPAPQGTTWCDVAIPSGALPTRSCAIPGCGPRSGTSIRTFTTRTGFIPATPCGWRLRGEGRPARQVVRGSSVRLEPMLRSEPLEGPIATIPYSVIAAFLSRPGVLTGDEVKAAPYVAALRDDHQIAGTGHDLYVRKLDGDTGARYSVMHIDEPLNDPQRGRKLGS